MLGAKELSRSISILIKAKGRVSLTKKRGENFTLSRWGVDPEGVEDPPSCNKIKCVITRITITKGNKKCKEKKRFSVGWDTEGPPQIQVTRSFPTIGMADKTPVITVAPQKDICPQGKT